MKTVLKVFLRPADATCHREHTYAGCGDGFDHSRCHLGYATGRACNEKD